MSASPITAINGLCKRGANGVGLLYRLYPGTLAVAYLFISPVTAVTYTSQNHSWRFYEYSYHSGIVRFFLPLEIDIHIAARYTCGVLGSTIMMLLRVMKNTLQLWDRPKIFFSSKLSFASCVWYLLYYYNIKIKILSSCEIEHFVETYIISHTCEVLVPYSTVGTY